MSEQMKPVTFTSDKTYRCCYGHTFNHIPIYLTGSDGRVMMPCLDCLIDKLRALEIPEVKEEPKLTDSK